MLDNLYVFILISDKKNCGYSFDLFYCCYFFVFVILSFRNKMKSIKSKVIKTTEYKSDKKKKIFGTFKL